MCPTSPACSLRGVLGLSEAYVATLHNAAKRDGSAALVQQDRRGAPGKVTARQWEQARGWPSRIAATAADTPLSL